MQLNISDGAKADLAEIWDFASANSYNAADQIIKQIAAKFDLLSTMPNAGRTRDELQIGLRSFPVGHFLIIYRLSAGAIEIVRILHTARDINAIFSEEN